MPPCLQDLLAALPPAPRDQKFSPYLVTWCLAPRSPPLSGKTRWHLLRVSPENLRTYQTFPSGKRVTSEEREVRDSFFEYRA